MGSWMIDDKILTELCRNYVGNYEGDAPNTYSTKVYEAVKELLAELEGE